MPSLLTAALLVAVALLPPSMGSSCNIPGFDVFCSYWNQCLTAPPSSAIVGGMCLYARAVGVTPSVPVSSVPLAGTFRRVMYVQGPDAVVQAAGRHCTPEGRGRMLLNIGWLNPSVTSMFTYVVFALPCATMAPVAPSTTWLPTSAPITAAWDGVRVSIQIAYGNTAGDAVWDQMARDYSFAGGGLGPAGMEQYTYPFLAVCAFGTFSSPGCCTNATTVAPVYQALADAFSDPLASSSKSNTVYNSAAVLRAFLSNAIGANPFFNGDGYTFDGCTGYYSVVAGTEFLLPNKHNGNWGNNSDYVSVGEATSTAGFNMVWGPSNLCSTSVTPCDFSDGTVVSQSYCQATYGMYPASLEPFIFGGAVNACPGQWPGLPTCRSSGFTCPIVYLSKNASTVCATTNCTQTDCCTGTLGFAASYYLAITLNWDCTALSQATFLLRIQAATSIPVQAILLSYWGCGSLVVYLTVVASTPALAAAALSAIAQAAVTGALGPILSVQYTTLSSPAPTPTYPYYYTTTAPLSSSNPALFALLTLLVIPVVLFLGLLMWWGCRREPCGAVPIPTCGELAPVPSPYAMPVASQSFGASSSTVLAVNQPTMFTTGSV
eukprot:RCo003455